MTTLKELKEKFTELTNMPACKASVLKLCKVMDSFENFENKSMKSKVDWMEVLEALGSPKTEKAATPTVSADQLADELKLLHKIAALESENELLKHTFKVTVEKLLDAPKAIPNDDTHEQSHEVEKIITETCLELSSIENNDDLIDFLFSKIMGNNPFRLKDPKPCYKRVSKFVHPDLCGHPQAANCFNKLKNHTERVIEFKKILAA